VLICIFTLALLVVTGTPKRPLLRLGTATYFNVKVLNTPFEGLFMGAEENVEPVPADGTASVEDFYWLCIFVSRDDYFSAEGVFFVGRHKGIAGAYFVAAGGFAI
jgi:hypothetical protein